MSSQNSSSTNDLSIGQVGPYLNVLDAQALCDQWGCSVRPYYYAVLRSLVFSLLVYVIFSGRSKKRKKLSKWRIAFIVYNIAVSIAQVVVILYNFRYTSDVWTNFLGLAFLASHASGVVSVVQLLVQLGITAYQWEEWLANVLYPADDIHDLDTKLHPFAQDADSPYTSLSSFPTNSQQERHTRELWVFRIVSIVACVFHPFPVSVLLAVFAAPMFVYFFPIFLGFLVVVVMCARALFKLSEVILALVGICPCGNDNHRYEGEQEESEESLEKRLRAKLAVTSLATLAGVWVSTATTYGILAYNGAGYGMIVSKEFTSRVSSVYFECFATRWQDFFLYKIGDVLGHL